MSFGLSSGWRRRLALAVTAFTLMGMLLLAHNNFISSASSSSSLVSLSSSSLLLAAGGGKGGGGGGGGGHLGVRRSSFVREDGTRLIFKKEQILGQPDATAAALLSPSDGQQGPQSPSSSPSSPSSSTSPHSNCSRGTRKFPTALIIGVRKGGTRALIDMLKCHPDIVAATSEVHYFDREENFHHGVQWYVDHMPYSAGNQITIEKSPSYFVSERTPQRVHNMAPHMKIILIIRNPLDRLASDYTQLLRKGRHKNTFEGDVFRSPSGEVNANFYSVLASMYDVHFERWLQYFDLDRILVLNGDSLIRDPVGELEKVEAFLGVGEYFKRDMFYFNATKGFFCWRKLEEKGGVRREVPYCLGSAKGHQLPQIARDTVQRLLAFFRPHSKRFFSLIRQEPFWKDDGYSNVGTFTKF